MSSNIPLVSIITPVYNGEKYLSECIESVINQYYTNWEYIIVNNFSTDSTLNIASKYAKKDNRIRIINNTEFVDVIKNHNIAFRAISQQSKYCKLVSADDWIYPECIERLVEVAERYPSVGIVGCYVITYSGVRVIDLPLQTDFFKGQDICRKQLLGISIYKAPSSLLYRADMTRAIDPYYAGISPSADMDAFFRDLQNNDYGCVHQILSFERTHEEAITSVLAKFNSLLVDRLAFLMRYGPIYLSRQEYEERMTILLNEYYKYLAERKIHFVGGQFWDYQKRRFEELGYQIDKIRLTKAVFNKVMDLLFNPKQSIEKIIKRMNAS
jgi:glycosyltransferase involved in cell wall biosynthesis